MRQVTVTLPEVTLDTLDRLAGLRTAGNRSAMLAYAVEVVGIMLDHPELAGRLLPAPRDAVDAFRAVR